MRDVRLCRHPAGRLPGRGAAHASGLCPRTGPQTCPRRADVPGPEESSGLVGHTDREEEGLTGQARSLLDRGTTGVLGLRGLKCRRWLQGSRSTVASGRLGPVRPREPVSTAAGGVRPGGREGAWRGEGRFFGAQSNAGQRRGPRGHEATVCPAACTSDRGLRVGSAPRGYLQARWGLAPRGRSEEKHFSSRQATPGG